MDKIKLSPAQYDLMERIRKNKKVKCVDRIKKTYKKLIDIGLIDYDESYDYVIFTKKGKDYPL